MLSDDKKLPHVMTSQAGDPYLHFNYVTEKPLWVFLITTECQLSSFKFIFINTGLYTEFRILGFCCKHRKTAAFLTDIPATSGRDVTCINL